MSAINVFKQSHSLHVLTDGAVYAGGSILPFTASKVWMAANIPAIIAARGSKLASAVIVEQLTFGIDSFDQVKTEAGERLRLACSALNSMRGGNQDPQSQNAEIVIAGLANNGNFDCFFVCDHDRDGSIPWTPRSLGDCAFLPGDEALSARFMSSLPDNATTDDIDPERDGLRLLEMQRVSQFAPIGGFAQLTSMDSKGAIKTQILKRWTEPTSAPSRSLKLLDSAWDEAERTFGALS